MKRIVKAEYLRLFEHTNTLVNVVHDQTLKEVAEEYAQNKSITPRSRYHRFTLKGKCMVIHNDNGTMAYRNFIGENSFFRKGNTLYHVSILTMPENPHRPHFSTVFINEFRQ